MVKKITTALHPYQELVFQIVLHFLVFLFYSFDQHDPNIAPYEVAFFITYSLAALFIDYQLLPRFYYRKQHVLFFALVLLTIAIVILFEELIWEPIFFPGKRAENFPGVFFGGLFQERGIFKGARAQDDETCPGVQDGPERIQAAHSAPELDRNARRPRHFLQHL